MSIVIHESAGIDFTDVDQVVSAALIRFRGKSSERIYNQTYDLWKDWCSNHRLSPLAVLPDNVSLFLQDQPVTRVTRKRYLVALRRLAYILSYQSPAHKLMYDLLKELPVPDQGIGGSPRTRRALTPAQIDRVYRAWDGDRLRDKRNSAMIALMLATGMRRSEIAMLMWQDIDLERRILFVRNGKGDKSRDVTIVGRRAARLLHEWRGCVPLESVYVFRPISKQDVLLDDKPISGTDVYRVVKDTEKQCGVEFKPHDTRRSFITEALHRAPVKTVQVQVGHSRGDTTLLYSSANDAEARHTDFEGFRYGD
jgi:integrase